MKGDLCPLSTVFTDSIQDNMPQVEGAVGFPQDIRNFALEQFKAFAGLEKSLLRQEIRVIFCPAVGCG